MRIERGMNWENQWEEEETLIVGELGNRMVAQSGGRGDSGEEKEGNRERIHDYYMGLSK